MELADGGFDLTYTKPLSDATVADLAEQVPGAPVDLRADLQPTAVPKVAEEALDRHRGDGLRRPQGRHAQARRPEAEPRRLRALAAPVRGGRTATPLLSTEAWYTLNTLPGYVAPVGDGLYELEDGLLTGGAQFDTEHAGFTGTGFVSGFGTAGASSVKIDVNAAKAGDYRMALRYANGPNPFEGPKTVTLIVNGTSRQITLPVDRRLDELPALPRRRHARRRATNTIELKHADGRRRPRQPRLAAARAGGHDALRGRGGDARRRRERPDRARRLQRHSATSAATRTRARARRSR